MGSKSFDDFHTPNVLPRGRARLQHRDLAASRHNVKRHVIALVDPGIVATMWVLRGISGLTTESRGGSRRVAVASGFSYTARRDIFQCGVEDSLRDTCGTALVNRGVAILRLTIDWIDVAIDPVCEFSPLKLLPEYVGDYF